MAHQEACIWVSAPHEVDGYYVEVLLVDKKWRETISCSWLPTIAECRAYAMELNIKIIKEI